MASSSPAPTLQARSRVRCEGNGKKVRKSSYRFMDLLPLRTASIRADMTEESGSSSLRHCCMFGFATACRLADRRDCGTVLPDKSLKAFFAALVGYGEPNRLSAGFPHRPPSPYELDGGFMGGVPACAAHRVDDLHDAAPLNGHSFGVSALSRCP
jgi:hypothetical protein